MIKQSRLLMAVVAASALWANSAKADEVPAQAMQAPQTTQPVAPQAPALEETKKMGWGGIGFRLGFVTPSLKLDLEKMNAAKKDVEKLQKYFADAGTPLKNGDLDLKATALEFTPVIHLGGSGYFWKFEFPMTFGSEYTSYGLGMYPINIGYYIDSIGLMPYVSFGGILSYAKTADMIGIVAQARVAVGAKYYLMDYVPVTVDLGFSPYSAGALVNTDKIDQMARVNDGSASAADYAALAGSKPADVIRGGVGSMFNLTFGIEWL